MVTDVPPEVEPVQGETLVTIGPLPEPDPVGQLPPPPPVPVAVSRAPMVPEKLAAYWVPVGLTLAETLGS
jgi:hypothetical protein